METKNYFSSINPYTAILTRYNEIQEKLKMSSKHNTSENLLFKPSEMKCNQNYLESYFKNNNINPSTNTMNNIESVFTGNNIQLDLLDLSNVPEDFSFSRSKKKNPFQADNSATVMLNKDLEEEQILYEKIKEAKLRKNRIKGLTSLHHNREYGKILVNSMSNSQFVYDSIFYDKYQPLELKSHTSSFFVKSVLSPHADYVLSGSSDSIMYIWKIGKVNIPPTQNNINTTSIKFSGFHKSEVIIY
jgi:hypothetical protein